MVCFTEDQSSPRSMDTYQKAVIYRTNKKTSGTSSSAPQALCFLPMGIFVMMLSIAYTAFLVLAVFVLHCFFWVLCRMGMFRASTPVHATESAELNAKSVSVNNTPRSSITSLASSPYSTPASSVASSPYTSPRVVRKVMVPSMEEWVSMTSQSRTEQFCSR